MPTTALSKARVMLLTQEEAWGLEEALERCGSSVSSAVTRP